MLVFKSKLQDRVLAIVVAVEVDVALLGFANRDREVVAGVEERSRIEAGVDQVAVAQVPGLVLPNRRDHRRH